ncbi:NUDIX domain-containing protein [Candidatus Woesearchaeota archaeon]|nr:NUDIX domain-containing protein [Candidatus Woesearchaeota archaeon]
MSLTREFVATVYIVNERKVLLVHHKQMGMWLPPGGHIDENELPTTAALREVKEETGLDVELVGEEKDYEQVKILHHPKILQLEDIKPGHQHIDLIYFARMKDKSQKIMLNKEESNEIRWFSEEEFDKVPELVAIQARRAIEELK